MLKWVLGIAKRVDLPTSQAQWARSAIEIERVSAGAYSQPEPETRSERLWESLLIEGNGYEGRKTSKEQTKMPRFMLEGPWPCTYLLCCVHTPWLNYVNETFLLVIYSDKTQNLLCFVHGQSQKREQKHGTRNFVGLHNLFPLSTLF